MYDVFFNGANIAIPMQTFANSFAFHQQNHV